MLFIFHMFHVRTDLFSLSLSVGNHLQFVSIHILLSHPISLSNFNMNANGHTVRTKAYARSHKNTVNIFTWCTRTHHSIHQSSFFPLSHILCVLSPYISLSNAQPPAQSMCSTYYKQARKHTQARTHKVARLVGAMVAALLRSPRVAPGAWLPVVCQRLRVEFIQIKAVEWGLSPRMPRPSPSSAFRRWE